MSRNAHAYSCIAQPDLRSNRSNTRKSVSSGYPNPEKCVEKRGRRPSFLTTSRLQVFHHISKLRLGVDFLCVSS